MTNALYEPLIERDLEAFPAAANAFADAHSDDELFVAVARFAVLAFAPSMHGKRAVMACRAAHELRGPRFREWTIECARYAAESRLPWSEPPILEMPKDVPAVDLAEAIAAGDRLMGEQWLASVILSAAKDPPIASRSGGSFSVSALHDDKLVAELERIATDDALLLLHAATALLPILGEQGKYALLRLVVWELTASQAEKSPDQPLETLIARAIASKGAIEDVHAVLAWDARHHPQPSALSPQPSAPYQLSRDYAQTLLAHAAAPRLPTPRVDEFLAAVRHNLEHGESFAEWSFA